MHFVHIDLEDKKEDKSRWEHHGVYVDKVVEFICVTARSCEVKLGYVGKLGWKKVNEAQGKVRG
jgi:hypothetical protein